MEIVVNLTVPAVHAEVSLAALRAGKHVWTEKPFAMSRAEGEAVRAAAAEHGLRVGGAPDTFLGAGLQTAFRLIERGDIGEPRSALTLFETPGPVAEHPNLERLLSLGSGPLWDIGPYYLTTLALALGSFRSVSAVGRIARPRRVLQVGPKSGQEITVAVPTYVSLLSEFDTGCTATSVLSWDSPQRREGFLEIAGTEATVSLPDPNHFDGDVRLKRTGDDEWTVVKATGPVAGRGLGVLDIARSVRAGEPHRASGDLAHHVLDAIVAANESVEQGGPRAVESSAPRPPAVPETYDPYARTL
ncbi:oxidoreductase [Mangrovihabitans endophyticus]|uniref:Oxidoreductase n=1 Tax=Mangrovihabitans endophyticus TaxID=1751298 RepID=A0A8J3FN71_9ACTN|nr:oxidoreductase [Mangrovihabitans endophyticus]